MYCQNCGKSDQTPNSYCRNCGEFLIDAKSLSSSSFGGITPKQNANTIGILSLFAGLLSLVFGILMYATQFNIPIVLYLSAAILICSSLWHFSSFAISLKLRKKLQNSNDIGAFNQTKTPLNEAKSQFVLEEAKFENYVPNSVTERTTKNLKVER